jgi:hypothetical protein
VNRRRSRRIPLALALGIGLAAPSLIRDREAASAFREPRVDANTEDACNCKDPGAGISCRCSSGSDPVNTATGAYWTRLTDASLPGIGVPFAFTRSYTSSDATTGRIGVAWTHNRELNLSVRDNGAVLYRGERGEDILYTRNGDGTFTGSKGARSVLSAVAGGYELLRTDQSRLRFDSRARLLSIKDRVRPTSTKKTP